MSIARHFRRLHRSPALVLLFVPIVAATQNALHQTGVLPADKLER